MYPYIDMVYSYKSRILYSLTKNKNSTYVRCLHERAFLKVKKKADLLSTS